MSLKREPCFLKLRGRCFHPVAAFWLTRPGPRSQRSSASRQAARAKMAGQFGIEAQGIPPAATPFADAHRRVEARQVFRELYPFVPRSARDGRVPRELLLKGF